MLLVSDGICPLCSQVYPREQLHTHMAAEPLRLRHTTILVIQAYHPGWLANHGACEPCWKSYRDAGRILHMLRSARPQNSGIYPIHSEPAAQNRVADQTGHLHTR